MSIVITPQTKVGELLDAFPGLDDTLAEWVPAFRKLKNPVLRRTVAKVATLEQAARIGGVSVRDLVLKVREATGQPAGPVEAAETSAPGDSPAPTWLDPSRVRYSLDADKMLETGQHPVGPIRQYLATLEEGELIELTSSFRPEPLIELMTNSGVAVYCRQDGPGRYTTWFCRIPPRVM